MSLARSHRSCRSVVLLAAMLIVPFAGCKEQSPSAPANDSSPSEQAVPDQAAAPAPPKPVVESPEPKPVATASDSSSPTPNASSTPAPSSPESAAPSGTASAGEVDLGITVRDLNEMCDAADLPHPPSLVDLPQDLMRLLRDAIAAAAKSKSEDTLGRLALLYHATSKTLDDTEQARILYEQVKRIAPGSYQWPHFLGRLFFGRLSYERSRMEFEESLRLNPDYTMNLAWVGEIESARENYDDAIEHFKQYKDSVENTAYADLGLAEAYLGKKDYESFFRAIASAQAVVGDCGRIRKLMARYFEDNDKPRAAQAQEEAAKTMPFLPNALSYDPLELEMWRQLEDSSAVITKIKSLASSGDIASALLLVDTVLSDHPDSPILIEALMVLHDRAGDGEQALAAARKLLNRDPINPTALSVATGILLAGERFEELLQIAGSAINADPSFAAGHACAGLALSGMKKHAEAEIAMTKAVELAPTNALYLDTLADMQFAQDKFDESEATLLRMLDIKTDPRTAREIRLMAYTALADFHFARENEDQGFEYLAKAVKESPQDDRVLRPLIDHTLASKNVDKAKEILTGILRDNPGLIQPRLALVEILSSTKRDEDAVTLLEEGVKANPQDSRIRFILSRAYQKVDRLDDAVAQLKKVIEFQPMATAGFTELSAIELRRSDPKEALKYARAGLQRQPQDPLLTNTIAWILCTQPAVLDANRALQLAKQACRTTGYQQPNYLDTLATAYAASGQFEEAVETENSAIKIAESNPRLADINEMRQRLELFEAGKPYLNE